MNSRFRRQKPLPVVSEINVTPLIDLAFALLIIFMITTPLMEQSIKVDLPDQEAVADPTPKEEKRQALSVNAEGTYFWGTEPVELREMDARLSALAGGPDVPVISIRGDQGIDYQHVVDIIALVQKHKLTKIHLDTQID